MTKKPGSQREREYRAGGEGRDYYFCRYPQDMQTLWSNLVTKSSGFAAYFVSFVTFDYRRVIIHSVRSRQMCFHMHLRVFLCVCVRYSLVENNYEHAYIYKCRFVFTTAK